MPDPPTYSIQEVVREIISSDTQSGELPFGDSAPSPDIWGYAQKIQYDHAVRIVGIRAVVNFTAGFEGTASAGLFTSRQSAPVQTSVDTHDQQTSDGQVSFGFDYDLAATTDMWVGIWSSAVNNPEIFAISDAASGDIPTEFQGKIERIDAANFLTWTLLTGADDYWGELEVHTDVPGTSITSDIKSISIRSGMNDTSGTMTGATCELVLDDHAGDYTIPLPANDFWRLNARIKIVATYDSTDYSLFNGVLDDVEPDLSVSAMKKVNASCTSWFDRFASQIVDTGEQSTAQEVVAAMGVFNTSEADVGDVTGSSNDVTVDNEAALSALNRIVRNGNHYHYVDGDGIYIMKLFSWLDGAAVKNYAQTDPDGVVVQFNKRSLFNNILITNGTGTVTDDDTTSQTNYGIRSLAISDNDIADDDRATIAARYLISNADQVNLPIFEFNNLYPDVFEIDFGTVIQYTNSDLSWTNKKFVVVQIERSIVPPSDHIITVTTREWFDMTP